MNTELAEKKAPVKRSRAQVLRDKVAIRLATDETGPLIAEVLKSNDIELPGADWSKVFPHWLVATVDDEVIGCIMMMPAKPFGFLEFLFTKKTAPYKLRIIAFRKLAQQGVATLQVAGCSWVLGTVEPGNKAYLQILDNHGVIHAYDAKLMAKRLR